jgi:hypothetical protein
MTVVSSPRQRQCELLPSLGARRPSSFVRRLSSINYSHQFISLRSQFYWWRKLEYPEKTTDLWQLDRIYEIFQLSVVLQVDTKCITDEIYFNFVTPVLNDWVKDCTDVLNFSITSLLFSTAHKYSIGDQLDYKVANWERKNCFSWRINDKHRAASHYLCIDWKLVWLSLLKPPRSA